MPRWNSSHRQSVQEIMKCNSKTEMAIELGWRYSVLLELPYFNAPQCYPMHNLCLGTGKHNDSALD